ncbi:MAG: Na+-transporting NADH:ubiquinone oxidoreductase subunit C [Lysobacterales bacterium]
MDKNSTKYIFGFALIVCLICSFLLTFASQILKTKQQLNVSLDKKKNILKVVSLREPLSVKPTNDELLDTYDGKITEVVLNSDGNNVEDMLIEDVVKDDGLLPLYIYKEGDTVVAYAFPVVGQGLWSTLYGYFSIEPDAITVRGITFYEHGETPGLGAEIEKDWFQGNFVGKKIWDVKNSKLQPVAVVKGAVENVISRKDQRQYYVDGISGATITSKGVTEMIDSELKKYEPFFRKVRK